MKRELGSGRRESGRGKIRAMEVESPTATNTHAGFCRRNRGGVQANLEIAGFILVLSSMLRITDAEIPGEWQRSEMTSLGVRARGFVDNLVNSGRVAYSRSDAREHTLMDIELGGLRNKGTILEQISCGYEASRKCRRCRWCMVARHETL